MTVSSESDKLGLVFDRQEIGRVLQLYCRIIDRLDRDLLRSRYWPPATDAHGTFAGNAHECANFVMEELRGSSSS